MSYERKVKVVLHGYLKELYKGDLFLSGFSASEIINGMCKITKAFNPKPGQPRHELSVVGFPTKESLFEALPHDITELHITPSMTGGKSGGFFRIVIGVVLIAAAVITGGTSLVALTATGTVAGTLFSLGVSLVLGGLLEMLSPTPKADSFGNGAADPEASKYLAASGNTVKIGTRIPLLYGEFKAFGHYLSFDVDAKDVAV